MHCPVIASNFVYFLNMSLCMSVGKFIYQYDYFVYESDVTTPTGVTLTTIFIVSVTVDVALCTSENLF